jgi:RNA polymerase sigma-70 factor (ECF subfamily)
MAGIAPSTDVGANPTVQNAFAAGVDTPSSPAPPPPSPALPPPAPTPTFREVFETYSRFVWRSLLGLGVRESDAADASQQVFVVLHGKLDRLTAGSSLRTFVYGICLRVASDFRHRAHVRRELLQAEPIEQAVRLTPEQELSHRETLGQLDQTLAKLDPAQREVFVLFEIEDLTMIEVARAVGCPVPTAYSRLYAARRTVAATLGDPLEDL